MAHAHDRTLLASLAFADPDKKDPLHDLGCQYMARPEVMDALGLKCLHTFRVSPFDGWAPHPAQPKMWYRAQEVLSEEELSKRPTSVVTREVPIRTESARFDSMLTKGHGQYATTIGFIDVVLSRHVAFLGVIPQFEGTKVFANEDEAYAYKNLYPEIADDIHVKHLARVTESDLACSRNVNTVRERIEAEKLTTPVPEEWRVPSIRMMPAQCTERTTALFIEVKIKEVSLGDVLRQVNLYRTYVALNGGSKSKWLVAAAFKMSAGFIDGLRSQDIEVVHLGENFRKWAEAQRNVAATAPVLSI